MAALPLLENSSSGQLPGHVCFQTASLMRKLLLTLNTQTGPTTFSSPRTPRGRPFRPQEAAGRPPARLPDQLLGEALPRGNSGHGSPQPRPVGQSRKGATGGKGHLLPRSRCPGTIAAACLSTPTGNPCVWHWAGVGGPEKEESLLPEGARPQGAGSTASSSREDVTGPRINVGERNSSATRTPHTAKGASGFASQPGSPRPRGPHEHFPLRRTFHAQPLRGGPVCAPTLLETPSPGPAAPGDRQRHVPHGTCGQRAGLRRTCRLRTGCSHTQGPAPATGQDALRRPSFVPCRSRRDVLSSIFNSGGRRCTLGCFLLPAKGNGCVLSQRTAHRGLGFSHGPLGHWADGGPGGQALAAGCPPPPSHEPETWVPHSRPGCLPHPLARQTKRAGWPLWPTAWLQELPEHLRRSSLTCHTPRGPRQQGRRRGQAFLHKFHSRHNHHGQGARVYTRPRPHGAGKGNTGQGTAVRTPLEGPPGHKESECPNTAAPNLSASLGHTGRTVTGHTENTLTRRCTASVTF